MKSLRARLCASVWLVNSVVFALAALGIFFTVRERLEAEFDRSLIALVQASAPTFARRYSEPALQSGVSRVIPGLPSEAVYQIWSIAGEELGRSSELVLDELPRSQAEYGIPVLSTIELEEQPYRVVSLRYEHVRPALPRPPRGIGGDGPREPPSEKIETEEREGGDRSERRDRRGENKEPPPGARNDRFESGDPSERRSEIDRRSVSIALPLHGLRQTLGTLRDVLLASWLVASVLGSLLLALVVRRSLFPLVELKNRVERIDEDGLGVTLEISNAPAELEPVITQLQQFILRMRSALEREQSFTAHAAHELRTPLSGLRAALEQLVAEYARKGDEEERAGVERALGISNELARLVDSLLELSRANMRPETVSRSRMILAPEIESACLDREALMKKRGLEVAIHVSDDIEIETIPELLRRVIENLLDNAFAYADSNTTVRIDASPVAGPNGAGRIVLSVANQTSGLPSDTASRAFDLFWRAENARSRRDSYGIGLALCRRISRALGGSIHAEQAGDEFRVVLTLPT